MSKIKPIAFYLPQFHAIPENDKAYGKGFTEWTNTKKCKPLFEGHYQPRTPLNSNYYNLLDEGVMEKQAALAKEYGVYGFCYYHYWFKNGKKLLEKPLEKMLQNKKIDIPFCLCWANENWTKRWDGGNNEIIAVQDYDDMDGLDKHIDYLCEFFFDERYIKIDGRPLFLIYKPELIPNLKKTVSHIRKRVVSKGFPGIVLACQHPGFYFEGINLDLFDNYVQFQPAFVQKTIAYENLTVKEKWKMNIKCILTKLGLREMGRKIRRFNDKINGTKNIASVKLKQERRSFTGDFEKILSYEVKDKRLIAGAFTDWDNSPRNKNGICYIGSNPSIFGEYMSRLVKKIKKEYSSEFLFINAWNEWAEGAFLEPDEKYGYGYLEALKKVIENSDKFSN